MPTTIITNYTPPQTVNTIIVRGPQGIKGDGGDGAINEVGLESDGTILIAGEHIDGNNANGTYTITLPQSIAPTASPTFANITITGEASGISKNMVGLGNADNTSDADKPISTAQATAFAAQTTSLNAHKDDVSNPHAVTKAQVGLGNADNTSDADKPISTAQATAFAAQTTSLNAHKDDVSNPHAVTKAQVGLGNADNTSDADKPISTAQATAFAAQTTSLNAHKDDVQITRLMQISRFRLHKRRQSTQKLIGVLRIQLEH